MCVAQERERTDVLETLNPATRMEIDSSHRLVLFPNDDKQSERNRMKSIIRKHELFSIDPTLQLAIEHFANDATKRRRTKSHRLRSRSADVKR